MRVNTKLLIALSVVITIGIGFFIYKLRTNEHLKAVTEVKLSLLFQRKPLEPPLFELVLDIPKSHFKVEEEIPVKLYLINKSNYPIAIIHDVPFPLFLIYDDYDENDRPLYGGLQYLLERLPVLRPGQPYYGWDSRADKSGIYWHLRIINGLKIARMNDGYRLIASKPGAYTLKAFAEFEILDMKSYYINIITIMTGGYNDWGL